MTVRRLTRWKRGSVAMAALVGAAFVVTGGSSVRNPLRSASSTTSTAYTYTYTAVTPAGLAIPQPHTSSYSSSAGPKAWSDGFSVPGERRYAWADDSDSSPYAEGAAIAIVHGESPRQVLKSLAPDAATPIEAPAKVEAWTEKGSYQQLRNSIEARPLEHGWTLVVNVDGYRETEHHYLRALSAKGRAIVVWEDVNADTLFQYAQRRTIVREFDPLLYDKPWIGRPSRAEKAIHFGDQHDLHCMAKSWLLAARLTGVKLTLSEVLSQRGRIAVGVRGGVGRDQ